MKPKRRSCQYCGQAPARSRGMCRRCLREHPRLDYGVKSMARLMAFSKSAWSDKHEVSGPEFVRLARNADRRLARCQAREWKKQEDAEARAAAREKP